MKIAIDGGAATGKSTLGRALARTLNLPFVDTGLWYRAAAAYPKANPVSCADFADIWLSGAGDSCYAVSYSGARYDDDFLELPHIAIRASQIAGSPEARKVLIRNMQTFLYAYCRSGAVVAGRDAGTIVMPEADFKFYLTCNQFTATVRESARTRMSLDAAEQNIVRRNNADASQLRPSPDARVLDTSELTEAEILEMVLTEIKLGVGALV